MASILTIREQERASTAARRVGGYDRLIELERERRAALRTERAGSVVTRNERSGRIER